MKRLILLVVCLWATAVSTAQNNQILQNAGLSAPRKDSTPFSPVSWPGADAGMVQVVSESGYNRLGGDTIPFSPVRPSDWQDSLLQIKQDSMDERDLKFRQALREAYVPLMPMSVVNPLTQVQVGLVQLQQEFLIFTIGQDYTVYDECTVDSFVKLVVAENDPLKRILSWVELNPDLLLESNFTGFTRTISEARDRQRNALDALRNKEPDKFLEICDATLRAIANLNLK